MRKILSGALIASLALTASQSALAEQEQSPIATSGVIMGLSNYIWRGQTLSDDKPSFQADIMVEHESGFYVGTAFETYRYQGENAFIKDYEIDYYGGFYTMANDDIGIGVNVMKYTFGDLDDTVEYTLSLDYQATSFAANYDQDTKAWYMEVNHGLETFNGSQLVLHAGYFFDAEYYGFEDKGTLSDTAYDLALRFSYPLGYQFDFVAEAAYQEFTDEHFMFGLVYNF